jgi:hypothetical protein
LPKKDEKPARSWREKGDWRGRQAGSRYRSSERVTAVVRQASGKEKLFPAARFYCLFLLTLHRFSHAPGKSGPEPGSRHSCVRGFGIPTFCRLNLAHLRYDLRMALLPQSAKYDRRDSTS